jgi:hypothetical protein
MKPISRKIIEPPVDKAEKAEKAPSASNTIGHTAKK